MQMYIENIASDLPTRGNVYDRTADVKAIKAK